MPTNCWAWRKISVRNPSPSSCSTNARIMTSDSLAAKPVFESMATPAAASMWNSNPTFGAVLRELLDKRGRFLGGGRGRRPADRPGRDPGSPASCRGACVCSGPAVNPRERVKRSEASRRSNLRAAGVWEEAGWPGLWSLAKIRAKAQRDCPAKRARGYIAPMSAMGGQ